LENKRAKQVWPGREWGEGRRGGAGALVREGVQTVYTHMNKYKKKLNKIKKNKCMTTNIIAYFF
jgi:hypothetical protein